MIFFMCLNTFNYNWKTGHFHVGLHILTNQNQDKEMDGIKTDQKLKEYPFRNLGQCLISFIKQMSFL